MARARRCPFEGSTTRRLARVLRLPPAPGDAADGPAALRFAHAGLLHPGKLVAGLAARARAPAARRCIDGRARGRDRRRQRRRARVVSLAGGGRWSPTTSSWPPPATPPGSGSCAAACCPCICRRSPPRRCRRTRCAALGWRGREGVVEARRLFNYFRLTADDRLVFGGGAPRYHWGGRRPPVRRARRGGRCAARLAAAFPADAGIDRVPVTHAWTGVIGYTLDAPAGDRARSRGGRAVAARARLVRARPGARRSRRAPGSRGWCSSARPAVGAALVPRPLARLPGEALRWLSFRAAVGAMAVLDRVA